MSRAGSHPVFVAGALLSLLVVPSAWSETVVIEDQARALIKLRIGSAGSTIDVVSFNLAANQVGDGEEIVGTPAIEIEVFARSLPANSRLATLTVDSSTNLSNGTDTLAFSNISWIASDGDIPSDTFDGSTGQFLMSVWNSRIVTTTHEFRYSNNAILPPGLYSGRVVYTLTMP